MSVDAYSKFDRAIDGLPADGLDPFSLLILVLIMPTLDPGQGRLRVLEILVLGLGPENLLRAVVAGRIELALRADEQRPAIRRLKPRGEEVGRGQVDLPFLAPSFHVSLTGGRPPRAGNS